MFWAPVAAWMLWPTTVGAPAVGAEDAGARGVAAAPEEPSEEPPEEAAGAELDGAAPLTLRRWAWLARAVEAGVTALVGSGVVTPGWVGPR